MANLFGVYLSGVLIFCIAAAWYRICSLFGILGPYDIVKKKFRTRKRDLLVLFFLYPFVLGGGVALASKFLF